MTTPTSPDTFTDEQGREWCGMTHPDLPDAPAAKVTVAAFAAVWEAKGWQRTSYDVADDQQRRATGQELNAESPAGAPGSFEGSSPDAFSKAELEQASEARGLPTTGNKAELHAALVAAERGTA